MAKRKRTNNDQQNTIKKTTKWATRPPFSIKKIESEQWWSTIQPISTIKEKLNFYECSIGFLELFRQCGHFVCLFVFVVVVGYLFFLIIPPSPKYNSIPPEGGGGILLYLYPSVRPSFLPSVQDIFRRIFLSNCWWQKSDIWSQASYRYTILWVVFLDPSDSYFLFADFVDFYTHLTYICICTFFVAFF
jgi:hypothetical protein